MGKGIMNFEKTPAVKNITITVKPKVPSGFSIIILLNKVNKKL
jgi:hypothetical protein